MYKWRILENMQLHFPFLNCNTSSIQLCKIEFSYTLYKHLILWWNVLQAEISFQYQCESIFANIVDCNILAVVILDLDSGVQCSESNPVHLKRWTNLMSGPKYGTVSLAHLTSVDTQGISKLKSQQSCHSQLVWWHVAWCCYCLPWYPSTIRFLDITVPPSAFQKLVHPTCEVQTSNLITEFWLGVKIWTWPNICPKPESECIFLTVFQQNPNSCHDVCFFFL